jgi:hypothetical protein
LEELGRGKKSLTSAIGGAPPRQEELDRGQGRSSTMGKNGKKGA